MGKSPTKSALTDTLLRQEITAGKSPAQVARDYGLTRQSVSERVSRLNLVTLAQTAMQPGESKQYVSAQIDILLHLSQLMEDAQKLRDAYSRELADAHDPTRFDVGPRAHEVMVTYFDSDEGETRIKRKDTLHHLLERIRDAGIIIDASKVDIADPRVEMRQCLGEVRQILTLANNLMSRLQEQRAIQAIYEGSIEVIEEADKVMGTEYATKLVRSFKRIFVLGPDVSPNREESEK